MDEDKPPITSPEGDLLYEAWGVIANAPHGAWDEDSEWRQAAIRWRDKWHEWLKEHA